MYKSCSCMGIRIILLCLNIVLPYSLYMWYSNLTCDRQRLTCLQYSRYQSQKLPRNFKDLKKINVQCAEPFSFSRYIQMSEYYLYSGDITDLVKNALTFCVQYALFNTSISRSRYRCRYRTNKKGLTNISLISVADSNLALLIKIDYWK